MNIAIISPNKNAYSETFIQAHRKIGATKLHFLFGGHLPRFSESGDSLAYYTPLFIRIVKRVLKRKSGNPYENGLRKYLRKHSIQVVLAEYGPTGVEVMHICKELNIPLFVHFHGYDASIKEVLQKYREPYKELFRLSVKVFVVSSLMYKNLLNLQCPQEKLVLNVYGPSDSFLEIDPTFIELKSFIAIGRFIGKKAPYYTILSMKKVAERHPDAILYLAGEGELLEVCQNLVKCLKLEFNVRFLGVISPEQYANYLSRVVGFVQHSITVQNGDMEGTPVAVLEASAAGIPVIATYHAGIPDVIIHGETGLLVDEHDVDGMARYIIELIDFPQKARQLGIAGKIRIREKFSMSRHLRVLRDEIVSNLSID